MLDLYYDSTLLSVEDVSDQLESGLVYTNTFTEGVSVEDTSNADSDDKTDKKIEFTWSSMSANWAGGTDAKTLANIKFKILEGADLTSATTSIRLEAREESADYDLSLIHI